MCDEQCDTDVERNSENMFIVNNVIPQIMILGDVSSIDSNSSKTFHALDIMLSYKNFLPLNYIDLFYFDYFYIFSVQNRRD